MATHLSRTRPGVPPLVLLEFISGVNWLPIAKNIQHPSHRTVFHKRFHSVYALKGVWSFLTDLFSNINENSSFWASEQWFAGYVLYSIRKGHSLPGLMCELFDTMDHSLWYQRFCSLCIAYTVYTGVIYTSLAYQYHTHCCTAHSLVLGLVGQTNCTPAGFIFFE